MHLIERLGAADITHNVALSRSVGWPDVTDDWRVLHAAALVLGVRDGADLIAQGALGDYGAAASIAKMVVAPGAQRAGIGSRLLDELVAEAEKRSVGVLGLVATPFGQPLYESRGFATVGEVVVFTGTPLLDAAERTAQPIADPAVAARIERRFVACSRDKVLSARLGVAIAHAALPNAFGIATASEQQALVGPVIAETEADARRIASAVFAAVQGPVRIDVPGEKDGFRGWLRGLGLRELAVRAEMARGAGRLPWQVPQRFALIAQAWG